MGTISVSLPADGSTADVADYNTPITTIVNAVNGGLDNSNIASGAAIAGTKLADAGITNAKLSTTAGELGGAWQTWTSTLGAITIGNGTVVSKYTQVGKTIHARFELTWGSTTSQSGTFTFTLPVAASSDYTAGRHSLGTVLTWDNSASLFVIGLAINTSSTVVTPRIDMADGTQLYSGIGNVITATSPATWAVSDVFTADLYYEAA